MKNKIIKAKHFSDKEMECHCGCGKGPARMDPAVIDLAEDIREACGCPLLVMSAFRCKKHNRDVGGAPSSQHMVGRALDLVPVDGDILRLKLVCEQLNPNGGVGFYKTFVHIDTRGSRARWGSI